MSKTSPVTQRNRCRNTFDSAGNCSREPAFRRPGMTRPLLTPTLMARLQAYGRAERVAADDLIYQLGDESYDLILIESGRVDLLCEPTTGKPPVLIAEMGP